MRLRDLLFSCNNIHKNTIILLRLKTTALILEGISDVPYWLIDKEVKKFEIMEKYIKIWMEDR